MQSFRKIEWAVSEVFKDGLTDGRTDGQTNGLTDKGDYHGRNRVNPGSKINTYIEECADKYYMLNNLCPVKLLRKIKIVYSSTLSNIVLFKKEFG